MRVQLPPRRGFSLLELILALALSGLILVAVGMAIDLHLRVLSVRRTHVEEAQVARAVLRLIADDLRGAVRRVEMDVSAAQLPEGGIPPEDELPPEEDTEESTEIADTVVPPLVPGLYGNLLELQVDVSRLPRLDELHSLMSPDLALAATDIPSDLKTVSYYIAPPDPAAATTQNAAGGLVRRVLDRAVMQYAADYGDIGIADSSAQVIAPEVTSIQFQYYDGAAWYPEWDSDALGGLPMAVEIVITVAPLDMVATNQLTTTTTIDPNETDLTQRSYRLVVRLPAAELIPPEDESTTSDTTTTTGGGG